SLKWTRSQLFLQSRMLMQNRHINAWNAFIKAKLQDANDGIFFLGNLRILSTDLYLRTQEGRAHQADKASLLHAYGGLTVAEKQTYNACVLQAHQEKRSAARANPKAIQHDMNAAFTSMDCEHLWLASLVHIFSASFDGLLTQCTDEHVISNHSHPLNKLISECCELIQDGLGFILLEKNYSHKIKMNYTNYKHTIVEHCSVAL
ncbi:hypothetical protein DFH29DRAFT_775467, partial [Suillus ampliporus]